MKIMEGNKKIALPLKDTDVGDVIAIRLGTGKIVVAVVVSEALETDSGYQQTRLLVIANVYKKTHNIIKTSKIITITLKTKNFECIVITKAKEFAQNTMLQCWLDFDYNIPDSWDELTSYEKMMARRNSNERKE